VKTSSSKVVAKSYIRCQMRGGEIGRGGNGGSERGEAGKGK